MKAKPLKLEDKSYKHCEPSEATHVHIIMPGPMPNRIVPVIVRGSRDEARTSRGEPVWSWNGDTEKPTLKPSILCQGCKEMTDEEYARYMKDKVLPERVNVTCHTWVNDGRVQFLSDCTHEFAGKTLDLLDVH